MSDNVESLILEHLKGLRTEAQTLRSEMHVEFKDVKHRIASVETVIVGMKHESADIKGDYVRHQVSLDNLIERIQRIGKRLDLV